ncbi:MAG TPA: hypothetical protein ENJ95_19175 [Bacteroidetes bacterium]|nr:hypothetical protein [Bacteroidota bacterium]
MLIDFIIGLTLMNAMPHMLVGYGNIRFLGLFGYGNLPNIAYAALSTIISVSLFSWKYGVEGWTENFIYLGALAVLVAYWVTGKWLIGFFKKNKQ